MALVKNKSTDENREFWSHVETVAKQAPVVQGWTCSGAENCGKDKASEPQTQGMNQATRRASTGKTG